MLQIHGVWGFVASEKKPINPSDVTTGEFTASWNLNITYALFRPWKMASAFPSGIHLSPPSSSPHHSFL